MNNTKTELLHFAALFNIDLSYTKPHLNKSSTVGGGAGCQLHTESKELVWIPLRPTIY